MFEPTDNRLVYFVWELMFALQETSILARTFGSVKCSDESAKSFFVQTLISVVLARVKWEDEEHGLVEANLWLL